MDQHGSSNGAVGLFQDITNLKEAEKERRRLMQELEEQRMLLEAVLHQMPGGVAVMSATGKLILANEQVEQIFRQPVPPDIGVKQLTKFKIFHPDGRPYRLEEYPLARAVLKGETIIDEDIDFQRGDGSRGTFRASAAPIRDRHGDIMAGVVTFDDITERKQTEKKIQKLNVELGSRIREVSERTRQLEAANKELEAFSYSVSHDLRTPLRAIEGFARMLMEDHSADLDTEGIRLLNVIRSNTHIMGKLIDDLLALSRLGRLEIRAQEFDLGGLVTSVFGELQAQVPARQVQLILNPLSPAYGDRTLINQVVLNLLDNALKFTQPKEEAIIEVGGWTEGKEDIYFVKDNGVGFDMRYVDKIFGVFQRLHRGEDFAGTGVGLAIVQRIISRHGGRVWAAGKVDQGAVFYFALPRKGEGN
jgi:signal transduction histidine kinase